jgi:hypothetical protein
MTSSQITSMSRMAHLLSRWGPGTILPPRQMARIPTPQTRGGARPPLGARRPYWLARSASSKTSGGGTGVRSPAQTALRRRLAS